MRFKFSIDRGGTFTDIFCEISTESGNTKERVIKLLSEDPDNYDDAPTEGIRRILEQETKIPHPRDKPVETDKIEYIRMGTTVATNALLERTGERCALITTKGFRDLQYIGNQSRPKIFDLEIRRPELLYESVFELDERVVLVKEYSSFPEEDVRTGISHEKIFVEKKLAEVDVARSLLKIKELGIRSIAVVFLHAYTFPDHEKLVKEVAERMGCFDQISLSSQVMSTVRMVPRGCTTCVDAYLTPIISRYLASFRKGFDVGLANVQVSFMQSDGGLTPMQSFSGNRAILSGPAGGVVGFAMTSSVEFGSSAPVIGFDMGGTSTDVSRYAGVYEHIFESVTAGVTICSPQLDINTVAAGGGSRLFFRNGLFVVGPESAGAHPGPVCYRKGGPLTVTDANLVLGRLQPHLFPAIFGPNEDSPLDLEGSRAAFAVLAEEINLYTKDSRPQPYTVEEVAHSFLVVANEAMARPIRNLTTMKGHDVTQHTLACFGGAGPQHCCALAQSLGMSTILVHKYSGVLSAYGLSLADVVVERQEPFSGALTNENLFLLRSRLSALQQSAEAELRAQGFTADAVSCLRFLAIRYTGTDTSLMVTLDSSGDTGAEDDVTRCTEDRYAEAFTRAYRAEFGFELTNRVLLVEDVRVRAVGSRAAGNKKAAVATSMVGSESAPPPVSKETVSVYFGGRVRDCDIFSMQDLRHGQAVRGPALIMQDVATVVLEENCVGSVTANGDLQISVPSISLIGIGTALDPLLLSLFSHRFMGVAEQMGRTLQRTSVSVNIKERLDFSCALFDKDGGLVANAPHLPVHLGAMSEAVRYQLRHWGADLKEGDVLVSNHPQLAGGSHLPDITVITPVFSRGEIVFFVASRGHHADVGGISPGSMPPLSTSLAQEGAAIIAFKLVENGEFQESGITAILTHSVPGSGCSGTRLLADNLSDLRAQVAANTRGVALMQELVTIYGLEVVSAYMGHIQSAAESAVRRMLCSFANSKRQSLPASNGPDDTHLVAVSAEDFLDDGSPIRLKITIDSVTGSAVFDFGGTGHEVLGNLNAPPAVTASAVIYCLRCLLTDMDIPLNQGCMIPVDLRIPPQSLLSPSPDAAVVGGNVQTSQRVTDVILKAFGACAASQGCMNNLTFGDETFGYYETIAGGAGAGPFWHGASGVHTHMTNTRITDPEILERRYPVILRRFGLRSGSGGEGRFRGGEGVIRELEFRKSLDVSILSERRAFQPYGLEGGSNGARGLNILHRASSGRVVSLGGKSSVRVVSGDVLEIHTPGGGGYGSTLAQDLNGTSGLLPRPVECVSTTPHIVTSGSLFQYSLNQESA